MAGFLAGIFLLISGLDHTLQDQSFISCPPFDCGNFSGLKFPFYRSDGWQDCGLPPLGLTCDTDEASLYFGGIVYEVDNISIPNREIPLKNIEFVKNLGSGNCLLPALSSNTKYELLFIVFRPISIYTSLNAVLVLIIPSYPWKMPKSSYKSHRDELPSVFYEGLEFQWPFYRGCSICEDQGVHVDLTTRLEISFVTVVKGRD
ncbi:hypothetical protein AMTR_s00079p00194400 [Amborella trichopoda]|uniref:Wall-associated receptor kinase galacturonan-binding domain-containing protein n=1 Tax=Amborella trichopoda TaxID=13333 RepID=W1P7Z4_AMBTC|nr:hypothetical protein AMTR_s00079p00194400 [Amborella trichopoda]